MANILTAKMLVDEALRMLERNLTFAHFGNEDEIEIPAPPLLSSEDERRIRRLTLERSRLERALKNLGGKVPRRDGGLYVLDEADNNANAMRLNAMMQETLKWQAMVIMAQTAPPWVTFPPSSPTQP